MKRRADPTADELEERFLALLGRNRGRIQRLARAFSRTAADAEDLESEIHFQLWRALPGFDGRAREDTWLYRVALNTALLHGRREASRRRGREALGRERRGRATPPLAERAVEGRDRLARLRRAVAGLEELDRALVTLHLEELPHREIARVTGLSEGNVGVRLHRIRRRLAAELAAGEEAEAWSSTS